MKELVLFMAEFIKINSWQLVPDLHVSFQTNLEMFMFLKFSVFLITHHLKIGRANPKLIAWN